MNRGGDEISLTATEFELLRYLMRNPRRVLSKAQILDRVWNYDFGGQAERRRDLHLLPAQEDRRRPRTDDPHAARRRVRAARRELHALAVRTRRSPPATGRCGRRLVTSVLGVAGPWSVPASGFSPSIAVKKFAGIATKLDQQLAQADGHPGDRNFGGPQRRRVCHRARRSAVGRRLAWSADVQSGPGYSTESTTDRFRTAPATAEQRCRCAGAKARRSIRTLSSVPGLGTYRVIATAPDGDGSSSISAFPLKNVQATLIR